MTYEAAMTACKNGATVKRSSWTSQYIKKSSDGKIEEHITRTIVAPYSSPQSDIVADDWMQV